MTEAEIRAIERAKWPSLSRRAKRKAKLKGRYKGDQLDAELTRTSEKMWLLCELICERRNPKQAEPVGHHAKSVKKLMES